MPNRQATTGASFVAAHDPAPRQAPTTNESVNAKWLDNAGLGIGLFVVLVAMQWIVYLAAFVMIGWGDAWYPPFAAIQMWSAFAFFAGMVGFGLLMMWRSALDEREKAGEFVWLRTRLAELEEELVDDDEKIAELELKLSNTRQDLQERIVLQQRTTARHERGYTPAVLRENEELVNQQTYRDARLLIERACRNLPYSKDKMVALHHGWTQARWREAHTLACQAGLFRVAGNRTDLLVDDINTALSMFDVYCNFSVSRPD